jgi:tRNA G18 (ribose-2'-O)-methylase SpoU
MTARPAEVTSRLAALETRATDHEISIAARLPLCVLVDNVRSLWNVGSIFRSADACGVRRVVLAGITGCPPRRQISKTALGADEVVAWRYRADVDEALEQIVAEGYTPVAIETTPRAVPLPHFDWPRRVCIVVGNEVAGINPPALEACTHHVCVPMLGVKKSLNVAVAFGIAAYSAARALAPADVRPAAAERDLFEIGETR